MMLTTDCRRTLRDVALILAVCCVPSLAAAGVLKLHGEADFLGRDNIGNTVPLGSSPIVLKLHIDDPAQPPDPNTPPGIEGFGAPFSDYHFQAENFGIETGGGTTFNSLVVDRIGAEFDTIQGNVPDCINGGCDIPAGTIGNPLLLAPATLMFQIVQQEGTLPESFSSIRELAQQIADFGLDDSNSMVAAMYTPKGGGGGGSEGPLSDGGGSGGTGPEITSLTVLGHLTEAFLIPEPSAAALWFCAALIFASACGRATSRRCNAR